MSQLRDFRAAEHLPVQLLRVNAGFVAIGGKLGAVFRVALAHCEQVGDGPAGLGHAPVWPVHEHGAQRAHILCGIQAAFDVHVLQCVQGLVDVAGRGVLAVEHGKVLNLVSTGSILSTKARHRLAEIDDPVVGRGARCRQVDDSQFRVFLEQHRNRACTLGRFAARSPRVFGDIGTDNDRLSAGAVKRQVPNRPFHAINAAKAGVLEFGNFTAPGDGWLAASDQGSVDHTLDDNRTCRIIGARLRAKAKKLDVPGVDVVLVDQSHDGRRCHRIDALIRPAHAEAAADDLANLRPLVVGPVTPVLQPDAIRRDVGSEAADTNLLCFARLVHGWFVRSPEF